MEDDELLEERYLVSEEAGDCFIHPLEERRYDRNSYEYKPALTDQGRLLIKFLQRWMFKEIE